MKAKKFKARTGSPFPIRDAQQIGEELDLIKSKTELTPENVVDAARSPKSFLHNYFEWDDRKGAEQYRLQQARQIVNHIIEVVVIQGEAIEQRAYFNVSSKEGTNIYVTLTEAIKNPSYKKQLLHDMETTIENLLRLIKLFSSME